MANSVRVLIVDDSYEDQKIYRWCLDNVDQIEYQVYSAEDGESGLQAVEVFEPNIILVDYFLPDLSGLEFVRSLRIQQGELSGGAADSVLLARNSAESVENDLSRVGDNGRDSGGDRELTIPVIMLTGQGSEKVAVEAMKEGIFDYLIKGEISPAILHRSISQALAHYDLRRSLQSSEERFRAAVETMLDCFGIYTAVRDEEGKIIRFRSEFVNSAASNRETVAARSLQESHRNTNQNSYWESQGEIYENNFCVMEPPLWTTEMFREYCSLVDTGTPLVKEVVVYKKGGAYPGKTRTEAPTTAPIECAYDLRATRIGDGFVAVWREITDRKRAEIEHQQLLEWEQQARRSAEEANHLKDLFVTMVSHDLRSPLNAILGWTQMLQRNPSGKIINQAITTIERSAKAQLSLIDDLLDLSQIVRGSLVLSEQSINFVEMLGALLTEIYPLLIDKKLQLSLDFQETTITVGGPETITNAFLQHPSLFGKGDVNRLCQVFNNLISNAIKFTKKGKYLRLGLFHNSDIIRISVSDSGVGIAPEDIKTIFDQFYRSNENKYVQGIGLGLTIAKHIVDLHAGRIWAASEGVGKGSTFTVELPLTCQPSSGKLPEQKIY
ncbi:MAG: ATP-binding protein [Cyanobacteria bacterium P01_C01_bin.89]